MASEKKLPAENFRSLAAVVIDLSIILIVIYIYLQILVLLNLEFFLAISIFPVIVVGIPLYYALSFSKDGQSIGYKILKIKIINKDGKSPTFWQSFLLTISQFNTESETQPFSSDYGYGNSVKNTYDLTTIKLGESKWRTIISCGCLAPVLFVAIIGMAIFLEKQFSEKREQGAYVNIRGDK